MRERADYEAPWTAGQSDDRDGEFSFLHEDDLDGRSPGLSTADPRTHNEVSEPGEDAAAAED